MLKRVVTGRGINGFPSGSNFFHKMTQPGSYQKKREENVNEREFEEAVARMVKGDKTGLKVIYENYAGYIYRIIYEVLQSKENTEDVTSEFFIRLWDKAEQFKPGSGHKGYLASMARNLAIDFLRKHKREELTALMQD